MPRGKPVRTDRARDKFLAVLRQSCNVSAAARAAGIGRATAYQWRSDDSQFDADWKDAEDEAVDNLEQCAWDRATLGESDRMLEILLKGHRPEKYVDRLRAEHSGGLTHDHRVNLADAPAEVLKYLAGQAAAGEDSR